jgi:hypothetical protein
MMNLKIKSLIYIVSGFFVSPGGLEPPTLCLKGRCATTELRAPPYLFTNFIAYKLVRITNICNFRNKFNSILWNMLYLPGGGPCSGPCGGRPSGGLSGGLSGGFNERAISSMNKLYSFFCSGVHNARSFSK